MPFLRKRSSRPRRRLMRRRRIMRKGGRQSVHAPRKFVFSFKYADLISGLNGTNPDGYNKLPLRVTIGQIPGITAISSLFRQVAIAGVRFEYRTQNPAPNSVTGAQLLMVEDKDYFGTQSVGAMLSQDNCRKLVCSKNANMYVRKPRPNLYQQDAAGNAVKVIGGSKFVHWLSPSVEADTNLPHLCGQVAVADLIAGATVAQPQGELWCKAYVIVKEQALGGI